MVTSNNLLVKHIKQKKLEMSEDFLWVGCVDLGGVSINCGCESTRTEQNPEEEIHMWVAWVNKDTSVIRLVTFFFLVSSALSVIRSSL